MNECGIYVHIPFCKQKCMYCDFCSFVMSEKDVKRYIDALCNEIKSVWINEDITTIYFGGGTPSYIDSKYIEIVMDQILNSMNYYDSGKGYKWEQTIEVNPGTVDKQKLQDYYNMGFNRLSIGLQSTSNRILKEIGRIHTYEEFLNTYNLAREVGFKNINVDLMLGLPNQTLDDIKDSVDKILELNPEHISTYSLIVEDSTPMERLIESGKLQLPDEDIEREEYWYIKKKLEEAGYKHYEISNFAKPGYESKHNVNCWKQQSYSGFGLGAASYADGLRMHNTDDFEKYIEIHKEEGNEYIIDECQNKESMMKEYMMLGFRMLDGIDCKEFMKKFAINPLTLYNTEIEELTKDGLIVANDKNIRLTDKGLDLANLVFERFI